MPSHTHFRDASHSSGTQLKSRKQRSLKFAAMAAVVSAIGLSYITLSFAATAAGPIKTLNGRCLDNSNNSAVDNNPAQLWSCNSSNAQQWSVPGDGTIRIQGKCLMPKDSGVISGTVVVIHACNGSRAQVWTANASGTISNKNSGLCLNNKASGIKNGNTIDTSKCTPYGREKWSLPSLVPTPAPTPTATPIPGPVPSSALESTVTPTPPPSPAPTQSHSGPSGEAIPVGDLPGWKQIFADDFTKDAAVGSWGSDCDWNRVAYTGAQGQLWRSYPKCFTDTYQKRPYRADQVLSVANGVLNFHLFNVDGKPAGANPSPIINQGAMQQNQTYGRYTARFKVDQPNLSEYHVAWLLWPESEQWPADGEEDFPEGGLDGTVGGFHHYAGASACDGCQDAATDVGAKFTDWHTYTIEWTPAKITYLLDGKTVLTSTKGVPHTPMRWQLQTETNGSGTHNGNLLVDWVSVYAYNP